MESNSQVMEAVFVASRPTAWWWLAAQVELPTNSYISKDKGRLVNPLTD